ncbi:MAG: hypothetical protein OER86_05175 [Phycisphaerae bacterium]|nr:hypothetical protein [Phycisphaerae bacterium]
MAMRTLPALLVLLLLLCSRAGLAADPPVPHPTEKANDTKHVLVLGNSYSGGSAKAITELFKREAPEFRFTFVTPGGFTLERHLKTPATRKRIASRDWDFVVLQDQSQTPGLPGKHGEGFHRAAAELSAMVRRQGRAKILLFMTWGRRDGDRRNPKIYPDFTTMHGKLSTQYRIAAGKNKLGLAPVGDAFALIHQRDQALFRSLYKNDGSHPAPTAGYLAACVFYGALTGKPPAKIRWTAKLDPPRATTLRQAAADALRGPLARP